MANARSRAYKLQLSSEGIQLFLRCHDRLCRQVGDFLPYGMTLHVAVSLMDCASADEVSASLLDPSLKRMGGQIVRYVGTVPDLSRVVDGIIQRAERIELIYPAPQVWKVFLAALITMENTESEYLNFTFQMTAALIGRKKYP